MFFFINPYFPFHPETLKFKYENELPTFGAEKLRSSNLFKF